MTYLNNRVEAESIAARIADDVQRRAAAAARFRRSSIAPTPCRERSNSALREHAIPYQMVNGLEFYQRKEIKDVLAYLHLLNNPRDRRGPAADHQHAAARHRQIVDRPARAIRPQRGKSLLDAAREAGLIERFDQAGGGGRGPIRRR